MRFYVSDRGGHALLCIRQRWACAFMYPTEVGIRFNVSDKGGLALLYIGQRLACAFMYRTEVGMRFYVSDRGGHALFFYSCRALATVFLLFKKGLRTFEQFEDKIKVLLAIRVIIDFTCQPVLFPLLKTLPIGQSNHD